MLPRWRCADQKLLVAAPGAIYEQIEDAVFGPDRFKNVRRLVDFETVAAQPPYFPRQVRLIDRAA